MYDITTATKRTSTLRKRLRGISGGTSAGKTISILQWIIRRAEEAQYGPEVISVVSESMPHLRKGAMRDFLEMMKAYQHYREESWERTNSVYTFPSGTIVEFFGVESWEKVKGARRDILFINEANHITYETYTQLEIRTKKIIWLDWNPENEFWWYLEVRPNNDVDELTLTYKDNESLDDRIISSIESRKTNKNWWRVYGEGQLGEVENRIYTGWKIIKSIPKWASLLRYGLDFGYSNDPTVIVGVYKFNNWILFDEVTYMTKLNNKDIAKILKNNSPALVRADSSEPKSIDEIHGYGINIQPSSKGAGSVLAGIQFIQGLKVAITERSTWGIKEYRNYLWLTDNNGKNINEPSPFNNHFMDAVRYALDDFRTNKRVEGAAVTPGIPNKMPLNWKSKDGQIQTVDFWSAMRNEANRKHSTTAAEFH